MKDPVIMGRFGRAFGIKGWIKVISFTDPKENILLYEPWWVSSANKQNGDWEIVRVTHHHQDTKELRVKLEAYHTPEESQSLVNKDIAIPRELLPPLDSHQYYWSELEGLIVKNTQHKILGILDHLFETGSNDVMVVIGEKQHFIPFLNSVVLQVNLKEKLIVIEWDADF